MAWSEMSFNLCGLQNVTTYTVLLILCLLFIEKSIRTPLYLAKLPLPSNPSWIWGHEKQVFEQTVGHAYTSWIRVLRSRVFRIKAALFKPDIIIVADPFALTHIMQRNIYNYPHSEVLRPRIARLLGKSLGWVEGESEHRRMRHLLAPALSQEAIRKGSSEVFSAVETLSNSLEAHLTSAASDVVAVNIQEWTSALALDVIGRFGFGHDFQGGRSEDARKILGAWQSMVKMGVSSAGFIALMLLRRFYIINYFPLKALRAQGDVRSTIHKGVAKELILREENQTSGGNDLLSRLMGAYKDQKISLEELKDHISMFIMAGSETTSQTLSYAIWELAKNQRVQDTLRKEVSSFHSGVSYDDIQDKMPYLDAVCREILRFHPAGPYMERVAAKDDVLPLKYPIQSEDGELTEVFIKSGQTIIIPIYSIGRDKSVWGDGDTFRPERWLESLPPSDILPTGWSNLLTFSDGPRQCLGWRLAILEFKISLSTLITRFEFSDTGVLITNKVATSLQPMCEGGDGKNPRLPVYVKTI